MQDRSNWQMLTNYFSFAKNALARFVKARNFTALVKDKRDCLNVLPVVVLTWSFANKECRSGAIRNRPMPSF